MTIFYELLRYLLRSTYLQYKIIAYHVRNSSRRIFHDIPSAFGGEGAPASFGEA